jgi:hypothetical protein
LSLLVACGLQSNQSLTIEPMRPAPDKDELIPLGKMKGEVNGEFEAFYLAVDMNGQLHMNRSPEYSTGRWKKGNGWEPLTREKLAAFEKDLRLIPIRRHQLKA